jgi:quercetin dioxygenase-like cupin family protein
MRALIAIPLLLWSAAAAAQEAAQKPIVTREILSTTRTAAGQPIVLPPGPVRLIVTQYDIAPGATLPVHKHPYQRYAYVLAGALTVTETDTGAKHDYKAGDVVVEMVERWHSGQNLGTEPVRLLVIDQVPDGMANTVLRER